jgi:class 3 adenylate cyclase
MSTDGRDLVSERARTIDGDLRRRYSRPMEATPGSGSERRIVTVLFADLVGFTTLAERLDPDDLARVVRRLLPRWP